MDDDDDLHLLTNNYSMPTNIFSNYNQRQYNNNNNGNQYNNNNNNCNQYNNNNNNGNLNLSNKDKPNTIYQQLHKIQNKEDSNQLRKKYSKELVVLLKEYIRKGKTKYSYFDKTILELLSWIKNNNQK